MNIIRRFTRNALKYSLNPRHPLIKHHPKKAFRFSIPVNKKKCVQIALISTLIPQGKINVEDDLRKAVEEGETAILDLMNQLQDLVITASREYRNCLMKQIELIHKATSVGHEVWDELPKFRTLADELNNELNSYLILLKTIGGMAYDQTLLTLMIDKNSLQNVLLKYNELDKILQEEFRQNKILEVKLLEVKINNILSGTNSS